MLVCLIYSIKSPDLFLFLISEHAFTYTHTHTHTQIRELQEAQEKVKGEKAGLEEEMKPLQAQEANETKRNQTLQKKLDHEFAKIEDKLAEIDGVDAAIKKV